MDVNPEITQRFAEEMEQQAAGGTYRIESEIGGRRIAFDIFPGVFPPASDHSISTRMVRENLGKLTGKVVADIGCGSGYESIAAVIAGAEHVDAVDISAQACECARHNSALNSMSEIITIHHGDLFEPLADRKYDLIIANLPIVDFQPEEMDDIAAALYDPGWALHRRLLAEARDYLWPNGSLTCTHANLQSAQTDQPFSDFDRLVALLHEFGYRVAARYVRDELDYRWTNYRVQPQIHRWHRP